jgi:hypothetical protein
VEHVATWFGLILAVVGISLAVVAMLFTWVVNKRAETLNDETVKALTKLETDMARVSDDVRGLIRDAWSHLFEPATGTSDGSEEGAATPTPRAKPAVEPPKPPTARPDPYARTVELVRRLSPEAQWLLRLLHQKGGLTYSTQYTKLRRTPLGRPLFELTQSGIVGLYNVPGIEEDRTYQGVWPAQLDAVRVALSLLDDPPETVKAAVSRELAAVGYDGEESPTPPKLPARIAPAPPIAPAAPPAPPAAKPPTSDKT